jgi:hypothetical protein
MGNIPFLQNIFSFSGKFSLLSFTKTIHSKFRGNLPLKTEKIVPKMEDFFLFSEFFLFSDFFRFERKNLSSVKSKNFFFEEIRKKLLEKQNELATLEKKVILYNFLTV